MSPFDLQWMLNHLVVCVGRCIDTTFHPQLIVCLLGRGLRRLRKDIRDYWLAFAGDRFLRSPLLWQNLGLSEQFLPSSKIIPMPMHWNSFWSIPTARYFTFYLRLHSFYSRPNLFSAKWVQSLLSFGYFFVSLSLFPYTKQPNSSNRDTMPPVLYQLTSTTEQQQHSPSFQLTCCPAASARRSHRWPATAFLPQKILSIWRWVNDRLLRTYDPHIVQHETGQQLRGIPASARLVHQLYALRGPKGFLNFKLLVS